MSKKLMRVLSLTLVVCLLMACVPSASAWNQSFNKKASYSVITCGDKILGKTSTVTVKNNSSDPIKLTMTQISNCKVYRSTGAGFSSWSSITIYSGASASFTIKTSLGKAGEVRFSIENYFGGQVACDITTKNCNGTFRVG